MATLLPVAKLGGHTEPRVWHVAWSPNGATLASCGEDRSIRLWAPASPDNETEWRCVAILEEGHQRTIRWCVWSPDAKFLASCSFDGTASIWEALDGEFDCVAQLEGHENEVKAVAWSASGNLLATCGRDKSVFIWETEDENYEVLSVLHSHAADVKCVQWHPTQEVLASCSYDDTVKLYIMSDDDDFRCCSTLTGHTSTVWALCFSPDGTSLASCSDDRSVVLWRDTTGDGVGFVPAYTLREVHERAIYTIDWLEEPGDTAAGSAAAGAAADEMSDALPAAPIPPGLIATGGADDSIALIRASGPIGEGAPKASGSLEALGRVNGAHSGDVNSVAWRPNHSGSSSLLASCGDDGCVRLWRRP